ncbi:MAG: flavin reductase family protein [Hyphomicrobiales bacterium]|nr:flavin reductase family protein [Hyphomicrobiales bacterium]
MFYTAEESHGLPYDPFKAIIAPRPIGWIGSQNRKGNVNLAPYSFFNAVSSRPNIIAFSSGGLKDSAENAVETGEFTFSLATRPLAEKMNRSSANLDAMVNEFEISGLTMAPSRLIAPPFVKESPAALECKVISSLTLTDLDGKDTDTYVIFGQVVATHIKDEFISNGRFDTAKAQPIARCGYNDYATVETVWEISRPG